MENIIDLQTAINAKEMGFDLPCKYAYDKCDMLCTDLPKGVDKINYNSSAYMKSAPSWSLYNDWMNGSIHEDI